MKISVIIPTLNEERYIGRLLAYLKQDPSFLLVKEVLVVDGGSEDKTSIIAEAAEAIVLNSPQRQRAWQMNLGAQQAKGEILYFLHADTLPPCGFAQKIWEANARGYQAGCFRLIFDWSHWFLALNSWFTRFNFNVLRFGDQSLFVEKQLFDIIQGFDSALTLFEDQDIIARLLSKKQFLVIPDYVVTSARKYRDNGPFRVQAVYFLLYLCYRLGLSQQNLLRLYHRLIPMPRI